MSNTAKRQLLKAYLAGTITKEELKKYSKMRFSPFIMLQDGEMETQYKEIAAISEKIGYDVFYLDIVEIKTNSDNQVIKL